ncbi:MAG: type II toxin-antitoxin system PemK/MazF family toxin [Candidatus Omnitrophota bacterium]
MKKGDILLVRFPFTDLTSLKVRPTVVISPDSYNKQHQDLLLMFITTNVSTSGPEDFLLTNKHPEFALTGLKVNSLFKISKISILSKRLAVRKLGNIGPQISSEINSRLQSFLQLM